MRLYRTPVTVASGGVLLAAIVTGVVLLRGDDSSSPLATGGTITTTTSLAELPTTTASVPVSVSGPPATNPPVRVTSMAPLRPTRLVVPALRVDAPVIRLGLQPDGTLEVPAAAHEVGWWSGGVMPGAVGPAVLAGHVNLGDRSGVFARLGELVAGDRIEVAADDGTAVAYVVTRTERHPKGAFPTDEVYGMTPGPELRLITCGGDFDRSSGHYEDNIIAFAIPTG